MKVGEITRLLCWNIIVVSRRRGKVLVVQKFENAGKVYERDVKGYMLTYSLSDYRLYEILIDQNVDLFSITTPSVGSFVLFLCCSVSYNPKIKAKYSLFA